MIPTFQPSLDRLYQTVLMLTQTPRTYLDPVGQAQVVDYLQSELSASGFSSLQTQPFLGQGVEYKNVLAKINAVGRSRLVLGAHYDAAAGTPGADDNASAVAGLLEVARLLRPYVDQLSNLELAFYSGEEPPFFATPSMGSYIHAQSLSSDQIQAEAIILEMIGYFSSEEGSQNYPRPEMELSYPAAGDFIALVANPPSRRLLQAVELSLSQAQLKVGVESLVAPPQLPGVDLSDHRCYWQFGYPAIMVTDTAFMRNPNYHQPTDTIETLDFEKMGQVVSGLCRAVFQRCAASPEPARAEAG